MYSLKDLRAENAAQRFSRTGDVDDSPNRNAQTPGLSPATATATSPRAGRTLTPLTSTASLQPVATDGDSQRVDDDAEVEFRESRRRRRRRREGERDEVDARVDDKVRAPTVAASAEANKQSGFLPAERVEEEKRSRLGTNSELRATSVGDIVESRGPLASARGTPPQEKPKKMLTPLSARRARIEQQKRDEAERNVDVAGLMAPRARRRAARGNQSPADEDNITGGGTKSRGQKEGLPSQDGKIDTEDDASDSDTIAGAKGGGSSGDRGRNADPGADALGEEDEAVRPDRRDETVGGRFEIMRNRMKKGSEELMKRMPSGDILPRRPAGKGGWSGGRLHDEAAPEGGKSTAAEDKRQGRLLLASEDSDANKAGGYLRSHQDDSGSTSENESSVFSPLATEAEDDLIDDNGSTDSDKDKRGKPKKWGRAKSPPDASAVAGVDREVTLGHVVDRKMREMGYIRKPVVDKLKNRRSWRDRVAAEGAPEVHFIGELAGAEGFGSAISCRFRVEGGRHWTCLAGLEDGQTHVGDADPGDPFIPWNHPIDLHYTTKSIQGWPRLMVQVWQMDVYGRNVLRGYGFRHLPSNPGLSEVSLPCWRPTGTMQVITDRKRTEETASFFLGVTPRLTAEDAVFNRAWDQRCRLTTLPAGNIWMQVNVLFRNLQDQDMDSFFDG